MQPNNTNVTIKRQRSPTDITQYAEELCFIQTISILWVVENVKQTSSSAQVHDQHVTVYVCLKHTTAVLLSCTLAWQHSISDTAVGMLQIKDTQFASVVHVMHWQNAFTSHAMTHTLVNHNYLSDDEQTNKNKIEITLYLVHTVLAHLLSTPMSSLLSCLQWLPVGYFLQ